MSRAAGGDSVGPSPRPLLSFLQNPDVTETAGSIPVGARRPAYLGILALLAVSFMLYQIALLRELRYQLTTLFTLTPFLFSTVVFSMALGSLVADRLSAKAFAVLRGSVALLPIVMLGSFAATLVVAQDCVGTGSGRFVGSAGGASYFNASLSAFIAVAVAGYGVVFVLQGLVFALFFREGREKGVLSDLYGVDLLASGAGALLGGGLNFVLTPVQTVLLSCGLALVTLWASRRLLGVRASHAATVSLVALGLIGAELGAGLLSRLEDPPWRAGTNFSLWSRYRRIDVRHDPETLEVFADGILFQANNLKDAAHPGDPRRTTTELIERAGRPVRDVLIIGAGTGTDVRILRSVMGERLSIVAVELDPGFVDTARAFPALWESYRTAEVVVQEGRYFLERSGRDFDLVLYAYIDPQSAIGTIGIPDANFLYTDAGLRAAFARVRPGGYLVMNRVYLAQEESEFVRRTCATVRSAGIPPQQCRLYRQKWTAPWGYYGELGSFHLTAGKGVVPPDLPASGLVELPWTEGGRATTDLFPFSLGTGVWFDALLKHVSGNLFLLLPGVLAVAALGWVMSRSAGRSTLFVLGLGSFLVESLVLFNSFLLFGDPNLSAAIAVGAFLLWNGVGSLGSARLERVRGWAVAIPAAVLLYAVTAPWLSIHTLTAPAAVRFLLFTVHLSAAGIACGAMFPAALRHFREASVPQLFFFDVVGCALAPPLFWLAISVVGVWLVAAGAGLSYAVVCAVVALRSR